MFDRLKMSLHWLGSYLACKEEVSQIENGEWLLFSVYVRKMDDAVFAFSKPCLVVDADPNNMKDSDPKLILDDAIFSEYLKEEMIRKEQALIGEIHGDR